MRKKKISLFESDVSMNSNLTLFLLSGTMGSCCFKAEIPITETKKSKGSKNENDQEYKDMGSPKNKRKMTNDMDSKAGT